jgi:hypothetical protein
MFPGWYRTQPPKKSRLDSLLFFACRIGFEVSLPSSQGIHAESASMQNPSHPNLDHTVPHDPSTSERWNAIRLAFLDRIWIGMVVVALLAAPVSALRSLFTGWERVYTVHLIFLAIAVGCFLLRKRIDFYTRTVAMIFLLDSAAIAGLLTFGLLGSAWWWALIASLLVTVFYSLRTGLIHTAFALGSICLIGYGFVDGGLQINFDANDYIRHYSAWLTMLLGPALLTAFVFWALAAYTDALRELMHEIDHRRAQKSALIAELEQTLAENKTLRGFIPICAHCKKIRDDEGFWNSVETYMQRHADIQFSHGLCPPCGAALYGPLWGGGTIDP